ncbi:MAG: allantoinase AllB [Candidatus Promineifilaceae bacterium]|nr:allantoinase AllB [Candidatus Promineifilaceae bacterium]
MNADLFLRNGLVVTEETIFPGGIAIADGKIVELVAGDATLSAEEVIDVKGQVILPGIVDDHVHFNEPGREQWEGYRAGSMAAAAGGVTTFLEMPLNATPPSIDREKLRFKREAIKDESVVDYAHWGGLVDNNLDQLDGLHEDGVIAFKGFMSESGVDFKRINDDVLYGGLVKSRELGNVVGVHAESEYVTRYLAQQIQSEGRIDRQAWSDSRPPESELEADKRAIYWAKVSGGNLHIVHTTIAEGIYAVNQAKIEGVNVTVETCPHYLFFANDDFVRIGPAAKCAPPIREREEVEKLWTCVLAGMVDTIASDHSPCPTADKEKGLDNIWNAWGGITGVQAMLPAMLTEGVNKRGLPLTLLVKMMSANPARIFGLYPQKGSLLPGSDADITVIDLQKEWTLTAEDLFSRHQQSAYVGYTFKGAVDRTIVRGKTVYRGGEITVEPGNGQLLRRVD